MWYIAVTFLLTLRLLISIFYYLFKKINFLFIEKVNIFSLFFIDDVVIHTILCLIYFGYMAYNYYKNTDLAEEPLNASPHISSQTIQSKMNQVLEEEKKSEEKANEENPNSQSENSQESKDNLVSSDNLYNNDNNTTNENVENNFIKVEYFKYLFCLQVGNILNRFYYQDLILNYGGSLLSDYRKDDFGINFKNTFNIFIFVVFVCLELIVKNRKRNPDLIKDGIVLVGCVVCLTITCSLYTCFYDSSVSKGSFLLYTVFHIIGVAVSYCVYDYSVHKLNNGGNYQCLSP
jgi:membrane-associated HD superfamily phosphohydrolase